MTFNVVDGFGSVPVYVGETTFDRRRDKVRPSASRFAMRVRCTDCCNKIGQSVLHYVCF